MANIDRAYVTIGLVWLVLGMLLGLQMGITGNNKYLLVHVAMLMGGFVVLTFYGAIYRLWPVLKEGALARAQFWCAATGTVMTVIGAALIVNQMGVAVAAGGSTLEIIGSVLMTWLFWTRTGEA